MVEVELTQINWEGDTVAPRPDGQDRAEPEFPFSDKQVFEYFRNIDN